VFVRATKHLRLSDTVYFKHRYITQPTITPEDRIVQAYHNLTQAIQGFPNSKGGANMEALQRLQDALSPESTGFTPPQASQRQEQQAPRVQFNTNVPELTLYDPDPRVPMNRATVEPHHLIVASPAEPFVASPNGIVVESPLPPQPPEIQQRPRVQPPDNTASPNLTESIADRIKARRRQPLTEPEESIADRVKRRQRTAETANTATATAYEFSYMVTDPNTGRFELACPVLDPDTGKLLEYRQLLRDPKFKETWERSSANDFGMLAQGVGNRVKGTNTIYFIHKREVPPDRFKDVTYLKFVCNVRPEKDDPNCTRATFGGTDIHYPDDCGTPTADLLLIKILLNSVISTPSARFANADLSNFYYNHELKRPEFARVKLSDVPNEIINEYKLHEKVTPDRWIYIKCVKTVPGLNQSGSLSHDALEARLNKEATSRARLFQHCGNTRQGTYNSSW
jgi:hypothetical protein